MPGIPISTLLWLLLPFQVAPADAPKVDELPPPVRPTLVTLDFQDQPISTIVQQLSERSGYPIKLDRNSERQGQNRPLTLTAPKPVSLLEAIDRLCDAGQVGPVNQGMRLPLTPPIGALQLSAIFRPRLTSASQYVGAFRLGMLTLVQQAQIRFEREIPGIDPRPLYTEATPPLVGPPSPTEPGNFYFEFLLSSEPDRLCVIAGPLHELVALDDLGQSMLSEAVSKHGVPVAGGTTEVTDRGVLLRMPLIHPERPGTRIKKLSGKIPLLVGVRSKNAPQVIPLTEAKGKTVSMGEVSLTVSEVKLPETQGTCSLSILFSSTKPQTDPPEVNVASWSGLLRSYASFAVEMLDEKQNPVNHSSSGSSLSGEQMRLSVSYPSRPGTASPAFLRVYEVERVAWDLPFQIDEIPLPETSAASRENQP